MGFVTINPPVRAPAATSADIALSGPVLEGIIAGLNASDGPAERRAWQRVPMRRCMAMIPFIEGVASDRVTVWVRDISLGGVGVIHSRKMAIDEMFLLELPGDASGQKTIRLLCAVAYCEHLADALYTIGARFKGFYDGAVR